MAENPIQAEMDFQREMQSSAQGSDPNAVYADSMREEKIKNVIAQLNPESLLSDIEHRIRGEKKNPFTEQWESIGDAKKQVPEELVQNYISFLNVYLTQNVSLSNFSPTEINNIMEVVIDYIRDDLSDNAEKYGLTKRSYINKKTKAKLLTPHITQEGMHLYKYEEIEVEQKIPIADEITDYNEFNRIGHIVCQSTFAVLKQAQNGMLAARIFKALRVSENLNGGKQSVKDVLKFW